VLLYEPKQISIGRFKNEVRNVKLGENDISVIISFKGSIDLKGLGMAREATTFGENAATRRSLDAFEIECPDFSQICRRNHISSLLAREALSVLTLLSEENIKVVAKECEIYFSPRKNCGVLSVPGMLISTM
jgi:hypothetical protein